MKSELNVFRKQAKRAATELGYKKDVLKKLNDAKTESEITCIMKTARTDMFVKNK